MKIGDLVFGAVGTVAWVALWCTDVGAVVGLSVVAIGALCALAR